MNTTALKARTIGAISDLRERITNDTITDDERDALDDIDGLIIDGVACWLVDGQIRTFTQCVDCGNYYEDVVKIEVTA